MRAFAPNGRLIIGTCDTVPVTAGVVTDSFMKNPETGELDFAFEGESEVHWDGQTTETVEKDGKKLAVFVDDQGNEWPEDEIILHEDGYYVEHNGDCWQSVFPEAEAEKSKLHTTTEDAIDYMVSECGIDREKVVIVEKKESDANG